MIMGSLDAFLILPVFNRGYKLKYFYGNVHLVSMMLCPDRIRAGLNVTSDPVVISGSNWKYFWGTLVLYGVLVFSFIRKPTGTPAYFVVDLR